MTFGEQKMDCEKTEIIFGKRIQEFASLLGLWQDKKPTL
jgi:hypothetical protein